MKKLSRREMLKLMGATGAAGFVAHDDALAYVAVDPLGYAEVIGAAEKEAAEFSVQSAEATLNEADDPGPHAEYVGQEQGQQIDDHLAGDVHEKAGQAHGPDVARQRPPAAHIFPPSSRRPGMQTYPRNASA